MITFQADQAAIPADQESSTAPEAMQSVPVDYETISEGAVRAVMQFNQQSNSLVPWTLKEVLAAAFNPANNMHRLTLRVTRGEEGKTIQVVKSCQNSLSCFL